MIPFVQLLGVAKVRLEGESVAFLSDKRFLLLSYLAYKADWVGRDHLAFLFWGDSDSAAARKNLRHLLSRVRALAFARIEVQGEQLRWTVDSDVERFQTSLGLGDWREAVSAYSGKLLAGLTPESPDFEDWLEQERAGLHGAYRDAALGHAHQLEAAGRALEASEVLLSVYKDDPLAEDVVQGLLRCAALSGHRAEGLQLFERFAATLRSELGLAPLEDTAQLARALRLEPVLQSVPEPALPEQSLLRNFPVPSSAFVGREFDLSEVGAYFTQPAVRLMTLIGAGGVGKTRLAVQVASEQAQGFRHGATFVALAGVADGSQIASAIANALGLTISSEDVLAQLHSYLSDKQLLLVLDNFEHLLSGAGVVGELLLQCPHLRVLVTSRAALNFHGEYLIDVAGLDVPKDAADNIEVFDSVQLLLRSARRVNPRFTLELQSKAAVVQICQLLQGSPLAIELASNWLRALSVEEVANEIRASLDFLSADQPDLPERHRSMKAVFDSSWVLLQADQQLALAKLSLLRGGFTLESAARVAHATPGVLLGLVGKSLIARDGARFVIHEAVRQYADQRLEPHDRAEALLALSLLARDWAKAVAIHDAARPSAVSVQNLELEFENLSLALEWSLQAQPLLCAEIVYLPWYFWFAAARKPLGIQWLTTLLESPALQDGIAARANLLCTRSIVGMRLVAAEQRLADAEAALEIARAVGDSRCEAHALFGIGMARGDLGALPLAIQTLKDAIERIETVQDINVEADCRNELAFLYWHNGDTETSRQTFEDLILRCRATGNKRSLANANANLAYVYATLGDLETEQRLLEQAIALYRESLNINNLCTTLLTLGNVMFQRGNMAGLWTVLNELGELCQRVQEAVCFSCFYALCAAFEQQRAQHAKALRLNAIATAWRSLPGQDFALDDMEPNQFIEPQSTALFDAQQLEVFRLEAAQLNSSVATQYALGQIALFGDKAAPVAPLERVNVGVAI
jgi:predicted ATPase/DNA-binding SARP family transcriptional activator